MKIVDMRVVIDTNVFLSHFLTPMGTAGKAIDLALQRGVVLSSPDTFAELAKKLASSKFAAKYGVEQERLEYLAWCRQIFTFVDVTISVTRSIDPLDNIFLALALSGRADFLISGDKKHLLALNNFEGTSIISPGDFIRHCGFSN